MGTLPIRSSSRERREGRTRVLGGARARAPPPARRRDAFPGASSAGRGSASSGCPSRVRAVSASCVTPRRIDAILPQSHAFEAWDLVVQGHAELPPQMHVFLAQRLVLASQKSTAPLRGRRRRRAVDDVPRPAGVVQRVQGLLRVLRARRDARTASAADPSESISSLGELRVSVRMLLVGACRAVVEHGDHLPEHNSERLMFAVSLAIVPSLLLAFKRSGRRGR